MCLGKWLLSLNHLTAMKRIESRTLWPMGDLFVLVMDVLVTVLWVQCQWPLLTLHRICFHVGSFFWRFYNNSGRYDLGKTNDKDLWLLEFTTAWRNRFILERTMIDLFTSLTDFVSLCRASVCAHVFTRAYVCLFVRVQSLMLSGFTTRITGCTYTVPNLCKRKSGSLCTIVSQWWLPPRGFRPQQLHWQHLSYLVNLYLKTLVGNSLSGHKMSPSILSFTYTHTGPMFEFISFPKKVIITNGKLKIKSV